MQWVPVQAIFGNKNAGKNTDGAEDVKRARIFMKKGNGNHNTGNRVYIREYADFFCSYFCKSVKHTPVCNCRHKDDSEYNTDYTAHVDLRQRPGLHFEQR